MPLILLLLPMLIASPSYSADNKIENWYTFWAMGPTSNVYPGDLDKELKELEKTPGVDHFAATFDFLGFYWPIGEQTLLGGVVHSTSDAYEVLGLKFDIYNYLPAFSMMHFFKHRIGQGVFVRADVGTAQHVVTVKGFGLEEETESNFGTGFLLGGGYGFAPWSGTRILLNGTYSLHHVEGDVTTSLSFSVGGLF